MVFQAGNVHESASLFNLKENKLIWKTVGFETHDPGGPEAVYYANHMTTEDLLDNSEKN